MRTPLARLRRHVTYANVMSTFAAFVALSAGSAYAASMIDGHLIKPGTIKSQQIKDGTLGIVDLSRAARYKLQGPKGRPGAMGVAGTNGRDGANGANGTNGTNGLSQLDGLGCRRGSTDGTTRIVPASTGYLSVFCEIPQAPDADEPNDSTGAAATVPVATATAVTHGATFHTGTDVDYYLVSMDCQTSGSVSIDSSAKIISATMNGAATGHNDYRVYTTGCPGNHVNYVVGVQSSNGYMDQYNLYASSDGA